MWINLSDPKKTIFLLDEEQGSLQYSLDEVYNIQELKEQLTEIIK